VPCALAPANAKPLRLITAVLLVEELLAMVIAPVVTPAAVGRNCTLSVAVCWGLNVSGSVDADIVKPLPVSAIVLIVTGAVPVDVKVTDCVAAVFTTTSGNATTVLLTPSARIQALNCRANLMELLPAFAVSVTVCGVKTDDTFAVNWALVAFAGTVTVAGTVTAALLLERLTLCLLADAELSFTVQTSVADPIAVALLQENALNAGPTGAPLIPTGVVLSVTLLDDAMGSPDSAPLAP
jgi:hypothetical protein